MEKPVLNRTQRAWLQEIGIDARMLAHLSTDVEHPRVAPPGPVPVAQLIQRAPLAPVPAPEPTAASSVPASEPTAARPVTTAARPAEKLAGNASLSDLRHHAENCQACGLHEVRGQMVFGEGVEGSPQWMFIGEAPGEYDDTVGRPFQGRAGDLLRCMLQSVGIAQDSPVYFTNVLKCRPMGNRSPLPDEVAACMPLLRRQIQQLRPDCLVALGRVSASALLGKDADLDQLRGHVHSFTDDDGREIPLVVTHHPASLLLHGQLKAEAWRDLNLLADLRR